MSQAKPAKKKQKSRPAILVTGAAGGLANIMVNQLAKKYDLVGVDPRPLRNPDQFPGIFHQVDYRQRKMADVFRSERFHALVHLGRIPPTSNVRTSQRFNMNVLGTRNLLDLALKYSVKNVIVCSTFHVYGAHQHNHLYINEEDPLRASQIFPELADAVELDNVSTAFLLRHRDIRTVILRPVNIIGPQIQNQITKLLRTQYCPFLLGFDPMQQFVHEKDIAQAFRLALESKKAGVYNVSGEGVVPFSRAIRMAGSIPVPVPHFFAYPIVGALARLGLKFPRHLLDYFRYPTVVSDEAFRKDFGFRPEVPTLKALRSLQTR